MNKKIILLILFVFVVGWLSSVVYSSYSNSYETVNSSADKTRSKSPGLIHDSSNKGKKIEAIKEFERIESLFSNEAEERDKNSPYDWVKAEQISVYNDYVIIRIKNPEWSVFTDTKSMDPVIDSTSNAIEIIPNSEKDIHLGDIVAYKSKYTEGIITHRVVDIEYDALGWYATLKGDNNDYVDPGKVRFEQIKRVVIAVIY